MRILLTGFEPFVRWTVNPSAEVVGALAAAPPAGIALRTRVLPVAFAEAGGLVAADIDACEPEIILLLGLGGGAALRVERMGVNLDDIPGRHDNRGYAPEEQPIDPLGPAAYFATIPVRRLVSHLNERVIPAVESLSAGTFLCNHVLYAARHHCVRTGRDAWVGFIHLPALPEQVAAQPGRERAPSMALATQAAGIRLALEFLAGARAAAQAAAP